MGEHTKVHGPERLRVYGLALSLAEQVESLLCNARCTGSLADQLQRAADSVVLNIAEGSAHFSPGRKLYHYQTAHGSSAECVAALMRLRTQNPELNVFRARATGEMVSGMLVGLIHAQQARVR
jgi:four helix bundle protein